MAADALNLTRLCQPVRSCDALERAIVPAKPRLYVREPFEEVPKSLDQLHREFSAITEREVKTWMLWARRPAREAYYEANFPDYVAEHQADFERRHRSHEEAQDARQREHDTPLLARYKAECQVAEKRTLGDPGLIEGLIEGYVASLALPFELGCESSFDLTEGELYLCLTFPGHEIVPPTYEVSKRTGVGVREKSTRRVRSEYVQTMLGAMLAVVTNAFEASPAIKAVAVDIRAWTRSHKTGEGIDYALAQRFTREALLGQQLAGIDPDDWCAGHGLVSNMTVTKLLRPIQPLKKEVDGDE